MARDYNRNNRQNENENYPAIRNPDPASTARPLLRGGNGPQDGRYQSLGLKTATAGLHNKMEMDCEPHSATGSGLARCC